MSVVTNNISGSASNSSIIGITGSVIIGNSPGSMFPIKGTDTVFFGSGSDTSRSVFGGTAFISGSLFTNGNVQVGDASGDTLTINATTVSIPNNLNFDSNTLFIDASNNYVGIGTSSPARPLHVIGAGGWRASTSANASGFEFINVNNSTWRLNPIGTATNLEIYSNVTIPTNGTAGLGFNSSAGQTTDTLLYRSAAGILNLSGSSPGFMFKWIATSTPTVVGQFGMNISSGRPQAFISGTVRQLSHIDELVTGSTGQIQYNDGGSPGASSTLTFDNTNNTLTTLNSSATAVTASSIMAGASTVNLFNTTATTINFGAAARTLNIGGSLSTGSVAGSLEVTGNSVFSTVIEPLLNSNNPGGVTTFSLTNQSIFYVNGASSNITANFTNAQTTNNRIISTTVILSQSATARIVSAVQIDGVASTINWANNVTPTGNSGKQDIFGFSLIRSGSAWKTLGQMTTYG